MAKTCIKCGALLDDDEIFCGECGTKYEETQKQNEDIQETGFCSKCGERIRQGCTFCPKCGAPVAGADAPRQNAQAKVPMQGYVAPVVKKANKTAIVIAAIGAVTIVAVLLILLLSGVFEGGSKTRFDNTAPAGTAIEGTDCESTSAPVPSDAPSPASSPASGGMLSWPIDGYAALIPVLPYGTLSEVRDLGNGSYAIIYNGVTREQGLSYLQDSILPAGFSQNQIEENTGVRYAFRSYNADGVMFELVCEGNNAGIYIGAAY